MNPDEKIETEDLTDRPWIKEGIEALEKVFGTSDVEELFKIITIDKVAEVFGPELCEKIFDESLNQPKPFEFGDW